MPREFREKFHLATRFFDNFHGICNNTKRNGMGLPKHNQIDQMELGKNERVDEQSMCDEVPTRRNIDFHHPYTPYPIQEEFMHTVYTVIEEGKVGILESPTGTVSWTISSQSD